MKQFLLLIALITTMFSRIFAQTATPPSGSGTSANPYLIASLENLYWVTQNASSWSKYFKQTANIDASSSSGWASGSGFSPIGNNVTNFTGTYDGNNYTISNLSINRPGTNFIGMFGEGTTATIKNLGLVNVNITGNSYVGGLIGALGSSSATITNCYVTGIVAGDSLVGGVVGNLLGTSATGVTNCYSTAAVTGSGWRIGGFVGWIQNSVVNSCYSTGTVSGTTLTASQYQYVGGFVGYNENSPSSYYNTDIRNCYSRGNVSASGRVAGGFAGYNGDTLVACYSTGTVSASLYAGGFCGNNFGTASACFWDTQTSGTSTAVGGGFSTGITGKTTAEMKTASTFTSAGWDFTVWEISPSVYNGYPALRWQFAIVPSGSGTSGSPYLISSFGNLLWITVNPSSWSSYFRQTADINADSSSWQDGLTPIGNYLTAFTGTYDGNNHTISNLSINRPGTNFIGMFGVGTTATIKNLGLVNVNITGNVYVGGLIGWLGGNSATITNCYVTGSVVGDSSVGGVVGFLQGTSVTGVTNCYSTATVTGSGWKIGGFVGEVSLLSSSSTVMNSCYSTGTVSGTTVTGPQYVGGFVGYNYVPSDIRNCYSRGNVSASGRYAGGFAGDNADTLVACYSTGTVSASLYAGGFCGSNTLGTASACFWDTQTSGTSTAVGSGTSTGITGKTTAEMKTASTFTTAGWDFTTVWEMIGTNYPRLRNNPDGALPVTLSSFTVTVSMNMATLHWQTATEVNNYGFEIERAIDNGKLKIDNWEKIGFVEGSGNSNSPKEYSYTDRNLSSGTYSYRLKQIDRDGKFEYSQEVEVVIAQTPQKFALMQNYPNPFNPTTTIQYSVGTDAHPSNNNTHGRASVPTFTTLKIYDVLGREVATLVNEVKEAGNYSVQWNASKFSSGIYYARLQSGEQVQMKKMLLLR
ncbi:MAG: GLUG motif-containing protein [Bacteroidota bacterium]